VEKDLWTRQERAFLEYAEAMACFRWVEDTAHHLHITGW